MTTSIKTIAAVLLAVSFSFVAGNQASAQYPTVYTTYPTAVTTTMYQSPAVVGYQAQPAGLLGLRTAWTPVYTPGRTVTVTRPATPVVVPTPVAVPAPVTVPTAVPVQTMRVPTTTSVAYPVTYYGI